MTSVGVAVTLISLIFLLGLALGISLGLGIGRLQKRDDLVGGKLTRVLRPDSGPLVRASRDRVGRRTTHPESDKSSSAGAKYPDRGRWS